MVVHIGNVLPQYPYRKDWHLYRNNVMDFYFLFIKIIGQTKH